MSFEEYSKEKLWPVLVETVHALTMYSHHKGYIRDAILNGSPQITPQELATRLNMPLGEAIVILAELAEEKKQKT